MNACSTASQKPPVVDLPIITVNGDQLDSELFSTEVQYHAADTFEAAVQKAGQALVIRQLLCQQLDYVGDGDNHDEQAIAELVAENATYEKVQEQDCRRYYEQNLDKFCTAPILEVSHILLAAAPNDARARIDKQELGAELIGRLQQHPELFPEFAIEFSDCPSKQMEGSLGQISTGQTVAEFERQLFTLPEGLHTKPLESRFGYHVVLINKRTEGKQLEFDMVEQQIQQYLDHRRYRQAIGDYLYRLAQDADIEGIELRLDQENIIVS